VRLYIRNANDFTKRFPLVVAAVVTLPARSCLIDGEAIVNNESGLVVFQLLRSWLTNLSAVLFVFELLELDGEDLPRLPIEVRKAGLAQLLRRKPSSGIAFNEHYVGDGKIIYQQACKLGCEGIVSKRLAR
jgi:bifunctional non-homologous end joining protein LigD